MPVFNADLENYIRETFAVEDPILTQIRNQMKARGLPASTVNPEEGKFLQVLVAASGVHKALEIGTLGGYSGTWIARGLAPGGRLISLEVDAHRAAVAKDHFRLAGLADRVEVRVGEAQMLLPALANGVPFDFIFIDADKLRYPEYLRQAPKLLRSGGLLAAHNVFRHGAIVNPPLDDARTHAMLKFNSMLASDSRWLTCIHPAGDGLAVAVLREGGD
jgi:predicted O-methyltransferase YrrM